MHSWKDLTLTKSEEKQILRLLLSWEMCELSHLNNYQSQKQYTSHPVHALNNHTKF